MESLKNFNDEKIQNSVLQQVLGGQVINTNYDCGGCDGSVGNDVTGDTNGDGVSGGKGDLIAFDDGTMGRFP